MTKINIESLIKWDGDFGGYIACLPDGIITCSKNNSGKQCYQIQAVNMTKNEARKALVEKLRFAVENGCFGDGCLEHFHIL